MNETKRCATCAWMDDCYLQCFIDNSYCEDYEPYEETFDNDTPNSNTTV
jgi:hypothetical protein